MSEQLQNEENPVVSILAVTRCAAKKVHFGQLVTIEDRPAKMGEKVLGIADQDARKGQSFKVHVLGVFDLVSGAPITRGDKLQSDDLGYPIPISNGRPLGYALGNAESIGDIVRILLRVPEDYVSKRDV